MGFADLHLHSVYSKDGTCSIETIMAQAEARHLDIIAITDHNSMDGVVEALSLMKKYHVQVIPGIEISTSNGHLLAYEITHPIPRGLTLKQTVLRIHELGGFCTIPHPASLGFDGIRHDIIIEALKTQKVAETILGIETINGGLLRMNYRAIGLAEEFGLAPVGNSDGHNIDSIGRVVTQFEGSSVEDLKSALHKKTTVPRWHHRTIDPLFFVIHTTFRILRDFGYGVGRDEKKQRPRLFPVDLLKK